jgi:thiamin-phosphate kinase
VTNLARPSGNITGVFPQQIELARKRLQIFKEALPDLQTATMFWGASRCRTAGPDLGDAGRHRPDDMPDLLQGRHPRVPMRPGDPRLLGRQLEIFGIGVVAGGAEWNVPVVGGDTGWGSSVCVSATAFGAIESGNALVRTGAKVGDRIFVSGNVGGFGAALAYFIVARPKGLSLSEVEERWLRDQLIRPIARVDVGRALFASALCTSCIDITDGLGQSLREIAEASRVCLRIEFDSLPVHATTSKVANMLGCGLEKIVFGLGLDLELLGTVGTQQSAALPSGLRYFGQVIGGEPGVIIDYGNRKSSLPVAGWQHFKGSAMELVREMYAETR